MISAVLTGSPSIIDEERRRLDGGVIDVSFRIPRRSCHCQRAAAASCSNSTFNHHHPAKCLPVLRVRAPQGVTDILNITNVIDKLEHGKSVAELPFYLGVFSAIAIKLTSSIDDIVWLVPFLIIPNRTKVVTNTAIYIWVCLFQAMLALAISHGGMAAIDAMSGSKGGGWSSEKILTFFAGLSLDCYGLKLAKEYYDENWGEGAGDNDDDDNEKGGGDGDENVFAADGEDVGTSEESGLLVMTAEKREAMGQTEGYGLGRAGGGSGSGGGKDKDQDDNEDKGQRTSSSLFIVRRKPSRARECSRAHEMAFSFLFFARFTSQARLILDSRAASRREVLIRYQCPSWLRGWSTERAETSRARTALPCCGVDCSHVCRAPYSAHALISGGLSRLARRSHPLRTHARRPSHQLVRAQYVDPLPFFLARCARCKHQAPVWATYHLEKMHSTRSRKSFFFLTAPFPRFVGASLIHCCRVPWRPCPIYFAVLGTVVAASIIVMLCVFLGMCKPVANFLESVPLAAIVITFGTFLTIKALAMS